MREVGFVRKVLCRAHVMDVTRKSCYKKIVTHLFLERVQMPIAWLGNESTVVGVVVYCKRGEIHRRPYKPVKPDFASELALITVAATAAVAVSGNASFSTFNACTVKL